MVAKKPAKRQPNIEQQKAFIREYVRLGGEGHGAEAYRNVYQPTRKKNISNTFASSQAHKLVTKGDLQAYLTELQAKARAKAEENEQETICNAADIIKFYSDVVKNKEKDQFGLDLPIGERIKAAKELYGIVGEQGKDDTDGVVIIDDIGGENDKDSKA